MKERRMNNGMTDERVMDERIKEGYRKIYAELLMLILLADAISLLVQVLVLKLGWQAIATEFAILIFAPLYLMVRQNMLGIHAEGVISAKRRRQRLWISLVAAFAAYMAASLAIKKSFHAADVLSALSFIAVYLFVYWGAAKINAHFYRKKMRKYEDD